jgi:hypothetical protein
MTPSGGPPGGVAGGLAALDDGTAQDPVVAVAACPAIAGGQPVTGGGPDGLGLRNLGAGRLGALPSCRAAVEVCGRMPGSW